MRIEKEKQGIVVGKDKRLDLGDGIMDAKQKWNRIVALHKQYYKSPETTIQNVWENICVEILGFSRLEGEVDRHRNIYLGSTERVIPDVIVKDSKKDLFVIELKLHNAVFEDGMRRQLFSYLKQLKLNVGVLVCEKLYIYGYDYSKQDNEQLCVEIPFEEDYADGEKFVEMFSKVGFSEGSVQKYVYEKNEFNLNVKTMSQKITADFVRALIFEHFNKTYTEDEIKAVLDGVSIEINKKATDIFIPPKPSVLPVDPIDRMDKEKAYFLLRRNAVQITKPFTFASLNKNGSIYWANPPVSVLTEDWWIVLNDSKKRELHYLFIPKNQFSQSQFRIRQDKNAIDFQVTYGSSTFVECRSKVAFLPFVKGTVKY